MEHQRNVLDQCADGLMATIGQDAGANEGPRRGCLLFGMLRQKQRFQRPASGEEGGERQPRCLSSVRVFI